MTEQHPSRSRAPLSGRVIANTRMADQASALSEPLRTAGATVIEAPTIELAGPADEAAALAAVNRLESYQWILLTSTNGVDALLKYLRSSAGQPTIPETLRVGAVGKATAEHLRRNRLPVDLIPTQATGRALAEALVAMGVAGQRILLPLGDLAQPTVAEVLTRAGAICETVTVYRTVRSAALPPAFTTALSAGAIDWITLTSPSAFANLLALLDPAGVEGLRRTQLASIGPVTSQAIRQAGFNVAAQADPHEIPGLVAAIIRADILARQDGSQP